MKKITKKDFKERCDFHVYSGGKEKHNVIYYDWKETDDGRGFKYAVAAERENATKKELFDALYDWVIKEKSLPYYIRYLYAPDDSKRFKVKLSLNF